MKTNIFFAFGPPGILHGPSGSMWTPVENYWVRLMKYFPRNIKYLSIPMFETIIRILLQILKYSQINENFDDGYLTSLLICLP